MAMEVKGITQLGLGRDLWRELHKKEDLYIIYIKDIKFVAK